MTAAKEKEMPAVADARGYLANKFLTELRVAEWNARKTFDAASLSELIESIREHGVQVPLLVRPLPDSIWKPVDDAGKELFEIVAGHRRFRAAQDLRLGDLPCLVRELTDDEAQEIGLVDNLQREDVPALEEADAYAALKSRLGTAAAIAQRVGKDVAYVTKRLQLIALGVMPRRSLAERLITVDHALLLARLGAAEQDENLKWALDVNAGVKAKVEDVIARRMKDRESAGRWGWREPQSVLSLKDHIEQHVGRKLKRAPWDLEDGQLLPKAGPCYGCTSNTRDNTALFSDLSIDEATCENGACFEEKRAAFVQIQLQAVPRAYNDAGLLIPALRLSWKQTTAEPRFPKGTREVNTVLRYGQWVKAKKKSCLHVRSGVTLDWSDDAHYGFEPAQDGHKPGEVLQVCIEPKCKAHPKAWEKAKPGEGGATARNGNSAEARAAREKQAELAKAENAIRAELVRKAIDGVKVLSGELLRAVVLQAFPRWSNAEDEIEHIFPGLEKALKTAKVDSQQFARAAAAVLLLSDEEHYFTDEVSKIDNGRPELLKLLRGAFGFDGSKAWEKKPAPAAAKASEKGFVKKAVRK